MRLKILTTLVEPPLPVTVNRAVPYELLLMERHAIVGVGGRAGWVVALALTDATPPDNAPPVAMARVRT